jgi:hypothetical protein
MMRAFRDHLVFPCGRPMRRDSLAAVVHFHLPGPHLVIDTHDRLQCFGLQKSPPPHQEHRPEPRR